MKLDCRVKFIRIVNGIMKKIRIKVLLFHTKYTAKSEIYEYFYLSSMGHADPAVKRLPEHAHCNSLTFFGPVTELALSPECCTLRENICIVTIVCMR